MLQDRTVSDKRKLSIDDICERDIYSKNIGATVFLSAVSEITESKFVECAKLMIDETVRLTDAEINWKPSATSLSFCGGVAGIIYMLLKTDFLGYQNQILNLVSLITSELIEENTELDIINGNAGCLSILTTLYEKLPSEVILEKICLLADDLLKKRVFDPKSKCYVWENIIFQQALTGFSHGASGMGYALLRAYEISKLDKYKEGFYEALKYEDYLFDFTEGNWPDLRKHPAYYSVMWCHGATGIGLARLYAYKILGDPKLLPRIRSAVLTTQSYPLMKSDFYCCGNIGRLDFLLEAAYILKENNLQSFVNDMIEAICLKKESIGHFQTCDQQTYDGSNFSLFRGVSGIGYVLLRCQDPEKFPSIGLLK